MQCYLCISCKHYLGDLTCLAFLDRIPDEILLGENDHSKPYPGQTNGIVYEQKQQFPYEFNATASFKLPVVDKDIKEAANYFSVVSSKLLDIHNFREDQPRVPAGNPDGGRWTSDYVGSNVKYKPDTTLNKEFSAIEKKFGEELDKNYEYYRDLYFKTHPNIISADDIKEFSSDYVLNKGELSSAVHEPSSAMAKKLFEELLKKPPVTNSVIFMAGGTGAGKTSGISVIPKINQNVLTADAVYDSNFSTVQSAKDKIEQVLKTGRDVTVLYIYRDPIDAFENGVIPRMIRQGRSVPIHQHVKTHNGSFYSSLVLRNMYKHHPRVNFIALDNSNGKGGATLISFGNLAKKAYLNKNLYDQLYESARQKRAAGKITEQQYRGLTGEGFNGKAINRIRNSEIAARREIGILRQYCIEELE